jgi:hypothetical protein
VRVALPFTLPLVPSSSLDRPSFATARPSLFPSLRQFHQPHAPHIESHSQPRSRSQSESPSRGQHPARGDRRPRSMSTATGRHHSHGTHVDPSQDQQGHQGRSRSGDRSPKGNGVENSPTVRMGGHGRRPCTGRRSGSSIPGLQVKLGRAVQPWPRSALVQPSATEGSSQ